MAKKERLIELLQEKRTALITHAVTKGLDPNAPMKPSGIDWLGDIPAHWDVSVRIKRVLETCIGTIRSTGCDECYCVSAKTVEVIGRRTPRIVIDDEIDSWLRDRAMSMATYSSPDWA